jgi:cytochrome oxidase Cu insertion factor (SCO1/SenC/PrrC family)
MRFRSAFSLALLSLVVQVSAAAQAPAPAVDVERIGPQVGQKVPDFDLPDQNGRRWTLKSLMGREGLMLVFFRSADW